MKVLLLFVLSCCLLARLTLGTKPTNCGLCGDTPRKSPENACRQTKTCYKKCGWWWKKRCSRTCTDYKCCKGKRVGSKCQADGCGGCRDSTVLDQPACYKTSSKLDKFSYKVSCGWWGKKCTKYAFKYVTVKTPYCCNGFKVLFGNRCCKHNSVAVQ